MIIICVNDLQSERLGISGSLVLADFVLLPGIDVGITIIYNGSNAVLKQSLYDCA